MSPKEADAVYTILVIRCGAIPAQPAREDFVRNMVQDPMPTDYRFGGLLGYGGKFHVGTFNTDGSPLWVTCYKEDETPERLHAIQLTNFALAELYVLSLSPAVRPVEARKLFKRRLQYFLSRQRVNEIAADGVGGLQDPELDYLLREVENL